MDNVLSNSPLEVTRDNPGDALVLKQKFNPEKMAVLDFFIVENNSKFYFSPLETSG